MAEYVKTYNFKMTQEVYMKVQTLLLASKSSGKKVTTNDIIQKAILGD